MSQKSFGGLDTVKKLKTVFDYASFYTTVLSGKGFKLHYLDAFAGTGEIPHASELPLIAETVEVDDVVVGSARRALELRVPFDRYVFADIKRSNTVSLAQLKAEYPSVASRIEIKHSDANETVRAFCRDLTPRDRALIFLDPFGNQVSWETLEIVASTKKVDLWYLFPAGLGVVRQISNDGKVVRESEASLDRLFGDSDWLEKCVRLEEAPDLFDSNRVNAIKIAKADAITRYMIEQMTKIFGGGVSESWLPLGRSGVHKFSLLFACANPAERANSLAQKVARQIMTRK